MNEKILILIGHMCSSKSSVIKELTTKHKFHKIPDFTTRPLRQNSTSNEHTFISDDEFDTMVNDGKFIEYREYNIEHENSKLKVRYGTPINTKNTRFKQVIDLPLEPALKLSEICDCVLCYMDADIDLIKRRAINRGDNPKEIIRRVKCDNKWIKKTPEYANLIIQSDQKLTDIVEQILEGYDNLSRI